jgi:hypothetical protein
MLGWFCTLKMEVIRSSETSVLVLTTRRFATDSGNITTAYVLLMRAHPEGVKLIVASAVQLLRRLHTAEGDVLNICPYWIYEFLQNCYRTQHIPNIFNIITCIRTTSWSTDVQHITSLYQIAYVQQIRCIKIVLQISNCISHLRMARRGRNM